jgi:5-methylcytosine-specific restriction endonuclease McrA
MSTYRDLSFRRRLKIRTRSRHRSRFWDHHDKQSYECPGCGRGFEDVGKRWDVHHRDGDALNGHLMNLIALCYRCHKQRHSLTRIRDRLDEWKEKMRSLGGTAEAKNIPTYGLSGTSQTTLDQFATDVEEVAA